MEKNNFDFYNFYDIEKLFLKENLENSEIIMAIIELGYNFKKYSIFKPCGSRFWSDISQKCLIKGLFKKYLKSTIEKYWRFLKKIKNPHEIAKLVTSYSIQINKKEIR